MQLHITVADNIITLNDFGQPNVLLNSLNVKTQNQ